MKESGLFLYYFVGLDEAETLVGLKLDAQTHAALESRVHQERHVVERLVKLARAGLPEDFEDVAKHVLSNDRERTTPLIDKVNYDYLARLLVLSWRDEPPEPPESVPVKVPPPPRGLRAAADEPKRFTVESYLQALRRIEKGSESIPIPAEEEDA